MSQEVLRAIASRLGISESDLRRDPPEPDPAIVDRWRRENLYRDHSAATVLHIRLELSKALLATVWPEGRLPTFQEMVDAIDEEERAIVRMAGGLP